MSRINKYWIIKHFMYKNDVERLKKIISSSDFTPIHLGHTKRKQGSPWNQGDTGV